MERLQVRWSSVTVFASLAVCCWCDKFCSVKGLLRLKSWSRGPTHACLDSNVDACIKFLRFFLRFSLLAVTTQNCQCLHCDFNHMQQQSCSRMTTLPLVSAPSVSFFSHHQYKQTTSRTRQTKTANNWSTNLSNHIWIVVASNFIPEDCHKHKLHTHHRTRTRAYIHVSPPPSPLHSRLLTP